MISTWPCHSKLPPNHYRYVTEIRFATTWHGLALDGILYNPPPPESIDKQFCKSVTSYRCAAPRRRATMWYGVELDNFARIIRHHPSYAITICGCKKARHHMVWPCPSRYPSEPSDSQFKLARRRMIWPALFRIPLPPNHLAAIFENALTSNQGTVLRKR
jgi:hypothetical protein